MATNDYRKKTFNRAMRGYNTEEVDEYIEYLSERLEEQRRENFELENKLKAALDKNKESSAEENEIKNTLLLAKRAADKIVTDAQAQADLLFSTAKENTDRVLRSFRQSVAQEAIVLEKLKRAVADMREIIYKQYLKNIEQLEELAPKSRYEEDLLEVKTADYIRAVVEGMKSDVETYKPEEPPKPEEPAEDAYTITRTAGRTGAKKYRVASVRDTIKELNKQILSDGLPPDESGKLIDGDEIVPKDADVRQPKRELHKRKKPKRNDIFDTEGDE